MYMADKKTSKKDSANKEFAVIATGGKQYVVSAGDTVTIEKIKGDFKVGDTLTFDSVLLTNSGDSTVVGQPQVKGASVSGELKEIGRSRKVEVIKYKAKSRYYKNRGHRQPFFKVLIKKVV